MWTRGQDDTRNTDRPFERHNGAGTNGSNGIRLENAGSSEGLSTTTTTTTTTNPMPQIPDPAPAWSAEEIRQKFYDGTYLRPPRGFWSGGIIEKGMHVIWKGMAEGPNGREYLYHGVVCGFADHCMESVWIK